MKKIIAASLLMGVALLWMATASQARPGKRYDAGTGMCRIIGEGKLGWESEPWGTGGRKFREVCKKCHTRNNDSGAPFLFAESHMPRGWNRIFFKRRVKCARDGSWNGLSRDELLMINDYLYRNGDWTYDPNDAETCG